ncbi:hypothetical protein F0562_032728 [Nyssa sinensis]|uniref:non-specific serine/threonine protein kinase n=1 Tax=Nyssa sinensis TaxID=561372 RepID=A0A5J5ANK0_9ASTE|nr:hypothetical protein F0562_032728 [Nyssa sinensis]
MQFEACVPKNCGDGQNISFPFWINGVQESYCGYPEPGFDLTCQNGHPILHIPDNDYVVQEIFFNNQSLRVQNAAFLNSNTVCVSTIRNITFEGDQFIIGCDAEYGAGWGLAIFGNDKNFIYALEQCGRRVVAPVEVYGDDQTNRTEDYGEVLRRGFVLRWKASNCSECDRSGGRCGFDAETYHFKCFCPDRPHSASCDPWNKQKLEMKVAVGISAAGLVIAIILVCFFRRKCSSSKSMILCKKDMENHQKIEAFLKNYRSLAPKRYSYSDVKKITNSFKDKLGEGGYGSVYKGKFNNGSLVAVKVLNKSKGNGEEFINEVASISKTSHINIVTLLGFCFEGSKRALIYEFMPNGSLEKFIYNDKSSTERQLGWGKLYQIALGIAQGLEYLHRGCSTRILHFDIKPHNILLSEDFCPKISDFGLAKLCPKKDSIVSMWGMRGTVGYIAPELFSRTFGGVSHKSDVYSYGMMILEMVGGRKNFDKGVEHNSEIYLPHWMYKRIELDEELGLRGITNEEDDKNAKKMIIVGLWCIQTNPSNRPSMSKVVDLLKGSLELLQIPPRPFLSSPPRPSADSSIT